MVPSIGFGDTVLQMIKMFDDTSREAMPQSLCLVETENKQKDTGLFNHIESQNLKLCHHL